MLSSSSHVAVSDRLTHSYHAWVRSSARPPRPVDRKKIRDLLMSGTTVVCDRYAYSGVAFSASKPGTI